jgi:phenylacetate-CoA ligase
VNIFPQQIERILMAEMRVGRNYLILLNGLDEMTVKVELAEAGFDGQVEHLMKFQNQLAEKLRAEILIKPKVQFLPPGSLPISEGKAQRVIDERKM